MKLVTFVLAAFTIAAVSMSGPTAAQSQDDGRRAAITLLRAINTAENAVKHTGGKYVALPDLLDHRAMSGVRPGIEVRGNTITHAGAQVRLALSTDATQYVVTVVSDAPEYTAAFTDERGVIYTGKALQ